MSTPRQGEAEGPGAGGDHQGSFLALAGFWAPARSLSLHGVQLPHSIFTSLVT